MDNAFIKLDRRIKRSHRLLRQSFEEIMSAKKFEHITIQEIVDRADVNRGRETTDTGSHPERGPSDLSTDTVEYHVQSRAAGHFKYPLGPTFPISTHC